MKRVLILLSLITLSNNKNKYCDIKGSINNPGVYIIDKNDTIQDIINKSGGLKNNSYTNNINLSKKVKDEMVIYIATKEEINELKRLNECDCSNEYIFIECEKEERINEDSSTTTTSTTTKNIEKITTTQITTKSTTTNATTTQIEKKEEVNKIININTCPIEDLIKLKGLGQKKAEKIIEYRNDDGYFETIEDIMKVNGIGKTIFDEIKNYIEV